jgi:hypothetical protein
MSGIPIMQQHMMGQRPLFPAAAVPHSVGMGQPKPTFPAYSNATISAPPTTNLGNSSNSTTSSTETQKTPTIPQNTGTASKIVHPPEDISLEELKARRPQYKARMNKVSSLPVTSSSAAAAMVSAATTAAAAIAKANEAKMVAAAHEVSEH